MAKKAKEAKAPKLPLIVALAHGAFLELFALDSISSPIGFLIHSIPSILIAFLALVAWKRPGLGAIFFALVGIAFTLFFGTWRSLPSFLFVSGPAFLTSALFLAKARQS